MKYKKELALKPNTLYNGDCLEVMRHWPDACVDLIYLDPPFNSKADYNVLFDKDAAGRDLDERAQFTAFKDTWHYTAAAQARVRAIVGDTQYPAHKSIDGFARIIPDSPMLAYLSYMAERAVEMHRLLKDTGSLYLHCDPTASHYLKIILDEVFGGGNFRNEIVWCYGLGGSSRRFFSRKHDTIFFYSKSEEYYFDKPMMASTSAAMKGKPKGMVDYWDIPSINNMSKERLGWPTQKPLALLQRIVAASSKAGDLVLDPFCGCGTTAHAAHSLRRSFVGIDIAIYPLHKICKIRLKDVHNLKIQGLPVSLAAAREMDAFLFEQWAVTLLQGFNPNNKQTGDGGVDGRATLITKPEGEKGLVIAQVKKGKATPDAQRALLSQIVGGKASMGVMVTLDKMNETPTMQSVVRDAGTYQVPGGEVKHPRMIYWSIEEYFAGVMPPLPEMVPTRAEERHRDWMTE